ncbi:iron ABC transporter substrate-binding protein [Maridesulfovibrio bastinii]|uniref:iron ABC transporter substrate-binding protein n=1 Tax=Maridesulfovibrio bastinii TaxID=47157 RepID=UPI0004820C31|nr:iron ABC transporter substrate-binding protein [Maridesulfovibrio bastinii]
MNYAKLIFSNTLIILIFLTLLCSSAIAGKTRIITDAAGRQVEIPSKVERVICSGPGCLRYLTYLQSQDMAVAVDDIEIRRNEFDARPYALANPQFKKLPLFGEFRGHDNPELILSLEPQPQLIFKTYANMGYNPDELQAKTGIPVVVLKYASLDSGKKKVFDSLKLMGSIIGKDKRAAEVCDFMDRCISELDNLTSNIPNSQKKSCYVGGIASKGPHGLQSTEPGYPPFLFVHALNVARPANSDSKPLNHTNVSKEQIVAWNPDYIFVDLSTCQLGEGSGALYELQTEEAYKGLKAVQEDHIYGLLPYNWYSRNFGSILADAYFIGKILYPEKFKSIEPTAKADEIYSFLVGFPAYKTMNKEFQNRAFSKISLENK